ncbi:MAG: Protein of unknown function (DUF559)/Domain of unknown function [Actinomycetia bacterium]|nr:Protein of unknown function (DUF559)/Domain of unknown function [Actinomycetes bacterium]
MGWTQVQRFVYAAAGAPDTYERGLLAAVLAGPIGTMASHRAAGRLHGIPGFDRAPVEILVPQPRRRPLAIAGARIHHTTRLPEWQGKTLQAIPTTGVARTLFDLGAMLHLGRTARAVDNCLSRKWVTIPALWRVLNDLAVQGRNGTCTLREILLERGEGYVAPASDLERDFLDLLRGAGLPLPDREVDLGDADQWVGRVEFVYRAEKLLIEIDSRLHHSALLDFESDRARDNRFVAEGYRVLRVTYEMLRDNPRDVERIIRRARRAAA